MSVDLESRILAEPSNVPGLTRTAAPGWFAPHDEAPLGYWRKPTDQTIFLGQYGENGMERKIKRGFTMLHQFGEFASAGTRTWDPMSDPFYPLVMKGGVGHLPPQQVKELGWHRVPDRNAKASHRAVERIIERVMSDRALSRDEAVLVVMPQLKGFDLTEWTCPSHPGRYFPTEAAKVGHDSVMHKEAIQSESIGKAVAAANAGLGAGVPTGDAAASNEALVTLIAQQGEIIARLTAKVDALEGAKPKGKTTKEAAAE